MDDYKELVQRLRRHIMGDDYFNINSDFASAVVQAADAIEQLVRERDAIAYDLSGFRDCSSCRHSVKYKSDCANLSECKWEWRGVSE